MDSFKVFYEKFSWNPLEWFKTPEARRQISEEERVMRLTAHRTAGKYIKQLKDVLAQRGYTIHKHGYNYTVRENRKVGLSLTAPNIKKMKIKDPLLHIPYIKMLFALAHEVGHVIQWDDSTDLIKRFDEFLDQKNNIKDYYERQDMADIHTLWYELDAWVEGMKFIPDEYKAQYKKFAYQSYKTYMGEHPAYYMSEMLLRNLLIDLNMAEQLK